MTPVEKLKQTSSVPNWIIVLLLPLMITIFFTILASAKAQSSDNAVFRTSIQGINERLNRIENKLDNHITVKN